MLLMFYLCITLYKWIKFWENFKNWLANRGWNEKRAYRNIHFTRLNLYRSLYSNLISPHLVSTWLRFCSSTYWQIFFIIMLPLYGTSLPIVQMSYNNGVQKSTDFTKALAAIVSKWNNSLMIQVCHELQTFNNK